jgi:hypothetical protein
MSIQTGIDGFRLVADRSGRYLGQEDPVFGPENDDGAPDWVKVTVLKQVQGAVAKFPAIARWKEYAQRKQNGTPTAMWAQMPYLMLSKCAEALALRMAFPAELSGVYTREEMDQADFVPAGPSQAYADAPARQPAKPLAKPPQPAAPKPVEPPPAAPPESYVADPIYAEADELVEEEAKAAIARIVELEGRYDFKAPQHKMNKRLKYAGAEELDQATLDGLCAYLEVLEAHAPKVEG